MEYQQTTAGRNEDVRVMTSRLVLKAQHDDERRFLAWLMKDVGRGGASHRAYIEEQIEKPDALNGLSDEDLADAYSIWGAICEGYSADIPFGRMAELEELGLIRELKALPGRGRYAGRFTFKWCDKLEIVVRAWANRTRSSEATKGISA